VVAEGAVAAGAAGADCRDHHAGAAHHGCQVEAAAVAATRDYRVVAAAEPHSHTPGKIQLPRSPQDILPPSMDFRFPCS